MRFTLLFAVVSVVFLSGCVPNKKIVYLQKDDLGDSNIARDTVLRSHEMTIKEYRIQPLDMLSVQFETLNEENDVFNFLPKLSLQNQGGGGVQVGSTALTGIFVNTEGEIEYPVLGKIKVAELTIFEAEGAIRSAAARFVADVVVRVRMLNFRFTVLGEVNNESTLISTNPRLTMMEAIGMAGGLTDLADRSLVKVIRQKGSESQVFYVNLLDENYVTSPYYFLQQNDVIIVPGLKQRTFRKYFPQNIAIVSSILSLMSVTILIISLTGS